MVSTPLKRLEGKVAVITASTSGIGFAIAKRLAEEGAKITVSSRKQENVDKAVQELKSEGIRDVIGVPCHVASKLERKRLFEETYRSFGGIDILVSNAAVNPTPTHVSQCDESKWDKIFDVNVKASFFLAKEVYPYLVERGGGSIVFVSSFSGWSLPPLLGVYAVSKTALFGLTGMLARYMGSKNIRVNCLSPGLIKTNFGNLLIEDQFQKEGIISRSALQRLGEPKEMAGVVAFLVSDDASYISGESINASGGILARL